MTDPAAPPGRGDRRSAARTAQDRVRAELATVRRKHPASVKFAIAGAVVLVLGAGTALYYGARAFSGGHEANRPQAGATSTATVPAAPPTLGPYGHIASRQSDPLPLTIAQLYPARFAADGSSFVQTSSRLSRDCIDAVSGAGIQRTVSAGGCSQVARASYLDAKHNIMGTIGVLNMRTATFASKAARAASANNFIAQLPGRSGPTHKLGQGTGMELAAAKGHYLILVWAEFASLRAPRTATQRAALEQFMNELLQGTANVSLSNRMVSGSPGTSSS